MELIQNNSTSPLVNLTMDAAQRGGALQTVTMEDIFLAGGTHVPSKKAVVVGGEPVAVVSPKYKLLHNEVAFSSLARAIETSGLDTTDLDIRISTANNGGRALAEFIFPAHEVVIGKTDVTQLRIVARNSYDLEWRYSTLAGGFRLACANGQVIGTYVDAYSGKHTPTLDVNKAADSLKVAANMFQQEGLTWVQMAKAPVSDQRAFNFLKRYMGVSSTMTIQECEEKSPTVGIHRAWINWRNEKEILGSTFWALYNVLTNLATYKSDGNLVPLSSRMTNEAHVAKIISSSTWTKALKQAA